MKIKVKVVPKAKKERIFKEKDFFKVYIKETPEKGRANKRLVELLADHFRVNKNKIRIIKGEFSREKVILLDEDI